MEMEEFYFTHSSVWVQIYERKGKNINLIFVLIFTLLLPVEYYVYYNVNVLCP